MINFKKKYFIKLDLRSGYNQNWIEDEDTHKIIFCTKNDRFEYLVMTFDLSNAPFIFTKFMNRNFFFSLDIFVIVFRDYIFVYNKILSDSRFHLWEVFQVLRMIELYAKTSKYKFSKLRVYYLGHRIIAK